MSTYSFDPAAIVAAFNRHGVDDVVIGGFAAELHAAPVEPTRDIDLTPATTMANLARVSAALDELGARLRTATEPGGLAFSHDPASLGRARVWDLTCTHGELDLSFVPSGTEGYDDLVREALRVAVPGGGEMAVASPGRCDPLQACRRTPEGPAGVARLAATPYRPRPPVPCPSGTRAGPTGRRASRRPQPRRRLFEHGGHPKVGHRSRRRRQRGPETGYGR